MDYIDEIISILSEFPNKDNLNANSVLKNTVILFSSLLRIRIVAKLEDRFHGLDFCWITENTTVNEINEFIKKHKKGLIDYQFNNSAEETTINKYLYNDDISIGVDIESWEASKINVEIKNTNLRKKLFSERILYSK